MKAQILQAIEEKRPPMAEKTHKVSVQEYLNRETFERERKLFGKSYWPLALTHEFSGENSAFAYSRNNIPYLLTAKDGEYHGFVNACSHRGTKLKDAGFHNCKSRIVCPYHNWTYGLDGQLTSMPHAYGFDSNIPGLKPIGVKTKHDVIWACPDPNSTREIPELDFLPRNTASHWTSYGRKELKIQANWKLIVESGLEFYHFKATHAATIYPAFFDNIGLVQKGDDMITVYMPTKRIYKEEDPLVYCHILYYFLPGTFVLIEDNMVNIIQLDPVSIDETRVTFNYLVPKGREHMHRLWKKRIEFTMKTLDEDYERTQKIQETLKADPERYFYHGKFEHGLTYFHEMLGQALHP